MLAMPVISEDISINRWGCVPGMSEGLPPGVVVLGLQGGPQLDAGLEEGAGLTDRLEGAVERGGLVQ
jgi:hypothetical protein